MRFLNVITFISLLNENSAERVGGGLVVWKIQLEEHLRCLACGNSFSQGIHQCPHCRVHFKRSDHLTHADDLKLQSILISRTLNEQLKRHLSDSITKPSKYTGGKISFKKIVWFFPLGMLLHLFQFGLTLSRKSMKWFFTFDKKEFHHKVSVTTFLMMMFFISFEHGLVQYLIQQALNVRLIAEQSTTSDFLRQISLDVLEKWRRSFPTTRMIRYFISLLIIWIVVMISSWFSSVITRARSWEDDYDDPPRLSLSMKDSSIHVMLRIIGLMAVYQAFTLIGFYLLTGGEVELIMSTIHGVQSLMTDPITTALPELALFLDLLAVFIMGIVAYIQFQFQRKVISATRLQAFLLSLPPVLTMWLFNVL